MRLCVVRHAGVPSSSELLSTGTHACSRTVHNIPAVAYRMLTMSCLDGEDVVSERRAACSALPNLAIWHSDLSGASSGHGLAMVKVPIPYKSTTVLAAIAAEHTANCGTCLPRHSPEMLMELLSLANFAASDALHERVVNTLRVLGSDGLVLREFQHFTNELRERIAASWLSHTGVPATDTALAIRHVPEQMKGALCASAARQPAVRIHLRHPDALYAITGLAAAEFAGAVHAPPHCFAKRGGAIRELAHITSLSAGAGHVDTADIEAMSALTALTELSLRGADCYKLRYGSIAQMISHLPSAPPQQLGCMLDSLI